MVDTTGVTGNVGKVGRGWGLGWAGAMGLVGDVTVDGLGISWALGLGWHLGFLVVRPRGMVLKDVVLDLGTSLAWGVALGNEASSGFGIALGLRGTMPEVEGATSWDFTIAASLRFSARFLFFFDALVMGVSGKGAGAGSEAELMFDVALMCLATALRREDSLCSTCRA